MLFLKQKKRPSTVNRQPSTVNRQPSTVNRQPSTKNSVNTLTPLSSVIARIILVINDVPLHFTLVVNTFSEFGLEVIVAHGSQEKLAKAPPVLSNITRLDVNQLIHEQQEVLIQIITPPEIDQLFRQIAEHLAVYEPTSSNSQTIDDDLVIAHLTFVYQARDLLLAHWQEPPSLKQLAHQVGTNPNKLSKAFQQHFGMTVFDYLREHRLAKAQDLLCHSTLPIQQIADTVGYQNHSDFTATFKQRFGLTPRQYRQHFGS
ncbi:hypothetical protein THII_3379 [Thioploca ingrica]|uniref:HTH araC/xylS-type domain-containing protein n=1 Tax=Thioploca ingrica TaxID=40754 RepID=A0A090BVY7_9GAMM|nr:hypothetical protein THII_3379 [Thioploca ingrica]